MNEIRGKLQFSKGWGDTYYGRGGFPIYLPRQSSLYPYNKSTNVTARSMLKELKDDRWIDKGTRAVVVEFSVYNTETEILSSAQLLTEIFRTGFVITNYRFLSGQVLMLETNKRFFHSLRLVLDCLDMCLIAFFIFRIFKRIVRSPNRWNYIKKIYNITEILVCIMFIVHWVLVFSFFLDPKVNKDMNLTEPHIFLETFDSLYTLISVLPQVLLFLYRAAYPS